MEETAKIKVNNLGNIWWLDRKGRIEGIYVVRVATAIGLGKVSVLEFNKYDNFSDFERTHLSVPLEMKMNSEVVFRLREVDEKEIAELKKDLCDYEEIKNVLNEANLCFAIEVLIPITPPVIESYYVFILLRK